MGKSKYLDSAEALMALPEVLGVKDIKIYWARNFSEFALENGFLLNAIPGRTIFPSDEDLSDAKHKNVCSKCTTLEDPKVADELCRMFSQYREEARSFFGFCRREGTYKFPFIKAKFDRLASKNAFTIESTGKNAQIILKKNGHPHALEDILDFSLYVEPVLRGKASAWFKSIDCVQCGKFFFFTTPPARFCSNACRSKSSYEERKNDIK